MSDEVLDKELQQLVIADKWEQFRALNHKIDELLDINRKHPDQRNLIDRNIARIKELHGQMLEITHEINDLQSP